MGTTTTTTTTSTTTTTTTTTTEILQPSTTSSKIEFKGNFAKGLIGAKRKAVELLSNLLKLKQAKLSILTDPEETTEEVKPTVELLPVEGADTDTDIASAPGSPPAPASSSPPVSPAVPTVAATPTPAPTAAPETIVTEEQPIVELLPV